VTKIVTVDGGCEPKLEIPDAVAERLEDEQDIFFCDECGHFHTTAEVDAVAEEQDKHPLDVIKEEL
jgi:hypothetical protein